LLLAARLAECCYGAALRLDRGLAERFGDHVPITEAALPHLNHILAGGELAAPQTAPDHKAPLGLITETCPASA
jgi:hypothetical protein